MFMVAIIAAVLLIGGVTALIITRKNHSSRAGQSGIAESNAQKHGTSTPAIGRSHTGSD